MAEPVTLAQMRKQMGITQTDDTARDVVITGRIIAVREKLESKCGYVIAASTWSAYSNAFPAGAIKLKKPLRSVTAITYIDTNNTQQTLSPSAYKVDTIRGEVRPEFGTTWPIARDEPNSVIVVYQAGYVDASYVHQAIKESIMFAVGLWENFQSSMEGSIGYPPDIPNVSMRLVEEFIDYRCFEPFTHERDNYQPGTPEEPTTGGLVDSTGDPLYDSTGDRLYAIG